jgi:phospholipid/cholesterol/gamma-HCH transport system permease protein
METLSARILKNTLVQVLIVFGKTLSLIPQPGAWRWHEINKSIVQIGLESLPIISVATAFAGLVVTQEMAWHMDQALHTTSMVPGFTGQFVFRELGIAIPALLLVSKVGAAITAEIGSMKLTEQVDALRLLGIDPIAYLVFPRFIAGFVCGASLTLAATFVTLAFSISLTAIRYHFSVLEYLSLLKHFITPKDLLCAVVKGTVYVSVIPIIAATYGLGCKGGAQGVGTATTNSVVSATITVILLDFILTYVFSLII